MTSPQVRRRAFVHEACARLTRRVLFDVAAAVATVVIVACGTGSPPSIERETLPATPSPAPTGKSEHSEQTMATRMPLADVRSWAYQIQDLAVPGSIEALEASHYDVLVLEPTSTDWSTTATKAFDTRGMVERLERSPASDAGHTKIVLAYVDVGQAESWRWYWTWPQTDELAGGAWPSFVLGADPDGWAGCWIVAYWSAEWRRILFGEGAVPVAGGSWSSIIDEVVADGFDGIYMDWVEAYADARVSAAAKVAGVDPATEMIRLIRDVRDYARARHPGFVVVQQNAAGLLDGHPELLDVVDGIAQENTWFAGLADSPWDDANGADVPESSLLTAETLLSLDPFLAGGKKVFTVDYAVTHADAVYDAASAHGYVPYCTRAALSQLTGTPPPALASP